MRNRAAMVLAAVPLLILLGAGTAAPQQRRESAIVGGHRIQPRADQFNGDQVTPDVPPAQAKELDLLYQQIMRDSAPPSSSTDVGDPNAAPPSGASKPR